MEVAPRFTLFTLFILFKLLSTAKTVACTCLDILLGKVKRYWTVITTKAHAVLKRTKTNLKCINHQKLCLWPRQMGKLAWGLFCTGFSFIAMVIRMIQILFLIRYAVPFVPAEKCETQQLKNIQVSTGSHAKMFIFLFLKLALARTQRWLQRSASQKEINQS